MDTGSDVIAQSDPHRPHSDVTVDKPETVMAVTSRALRLIGIAAIAVLLFLFVTLSSPYSSQRPFSAAVSQHGADVHVTRRTGSRRHHFENVAADDDADDLDDADRDDSEENDRLLLKRPPPIVAQGFSIWPSSFHGTPHDFSTHTSLFAFKITSAKIISNYTCAFGDNVF